MYPVYQPLLGGNEKAYVNRCLDSGWISSRGEFVGRFEAEFARFIGAPHATSVSNGTVALHLAMAALNIGPGDEVIVPTFTYVASVNTILQTGATPVYVDSCPQSWNIDVADIRRKITPRTRAIMAVHLYGLPCDMDALVAIAEEHQLLLIEDCAEAFGTFYDGRHVGTFGDAATFSFFGNKTITTGEGGMVVMRAPEMHGRAANLKSQGVSATREYWHEDLAYNYRMTNIQAAIGLAQLEQAPDIIARKRQIAHWYFDAFAPFPLAFQTELDKTVHSFWMVSALVETPELCRSLRAYLKEAGVETRPLFNLAHTMPHCAASGVFPVATDISARGINFPSYPALEKTDIENFAAIVGGFFKS